MKIKIPIFSLFISLFIVVIISGCIQETAEFPETSFSPEPENPAEVNITEIIKSLPPNASIVYDAVTGEPVYNATIIEGYDFFGSGMASLFGYYSKIKNTNEEGIYLSPIGAFGNENYKSPSFVFADGYVPRVVYGIPQGEDEKNSKGKFHPLCFCPGFVRGLSFHGTYAFVGLSKPRYERFEGLELDTKLSETDSEAWCGVQIIDLNTGSCVQWFRIDGEIAELYDVAVLPDVACAKSMGFTTDEALGVITLEE